MENIITDYNVEVATLDVVACAQIDEYVNNSDKKCLNLLLDSDECKNNAIKLRLHAEKRNTLSESTITNTACA